MHRCTNSWRTPSPLAFSFCCGSLQSWQVELGPAAPVPACPAPPLPLSAICGCWQLAQKAGMGRWSWPCWPSLSLCAPDIAQTQGNVAQLGIPWQKALSAWRIEFHKWWAVPQGRSGQSPPFTQQKETQNQIPKHRTKCCLCKMFSLWDKTGLRKILISSVFMMDYLCEWSGVLCLEGELGTEESW